MTRFRTSGRWRLVALDKLDQFLADTERRAFVRARIATGNADEAMDIVQDAMLALATRYAQRSPEEWGALFHTILLSRINDWHRRRHVRNRWFFGWSRTTADGGDPIEQVADTGLVDPADRHGASRSLAALESALAELPARQREAFLLRAWDGLDVAETARTMKCSAGSVKTHYSRAVHALREALGEHWP